VFNTRADYEIGGFATTLLASVERCSRPGPTKKSAASPPRCSPAWSGVQDQGRPRDRRLRHHAARQRAAVFKTRADHEIGGFATTLLASVERCSRPEPTTKSAASPPRCSPAWSGVQDQGRPRNRRLRHHAARQRGAVFKTRADHEIGGFATTLLASVQRCSRPGPTTKSAASPPRCSPAWSGVQDQGRPRNRRLRHHAARQRGAVFKTRADHEIGGFATTLLASVERCSRPGPTTKSAASPPRCSPAWSGVQDQGRPRNRRLRHHAARQRAAVFKTRADHEIGGFATTLLASVERCSRPEPTTKSAASPPRCSPAWSGVQHAGRIEGETVWF